MRPGVRGKVEAYSALLCANLREDPPKFYLLLSKKRAGIARLAIKVRVPACKDQYNDSESSNILGSQLGDKLTSGCNTDFHHFLFGKPWDFWFYTLSLDLGGVCSTMPPKISSDWWGRQVMSNFLPRATIDKELNGTCTASISQIKLPATVTWNCTGSFTKERIMRLELFPLVLDI